MSKQEKNLLYTACLHYANDLYGILKLLDNLPEAKEQVIKEAEAAYKMAGEIAVMKEE